jgi:GST-like protein
MLKLYSDSTPNGLRATVILEETGLPYELVRIDTERGEQSAPDFVALNPAAAIPVLVETDTAGKIDLCLPQSGAIVLFAAERSGRFIPTDAARRTQAYRWFFQVSTDITSASSWLFNHARSMPVKAPENVEWLQTRLGKALAVADKWLAEHDCFADEISIADFMFYPNFWFRRQAIESSGGLSNLLRWGDRMAQRPGVQRGMSAFESSSNQ